MNDVTSQTFQRVGAETQRLLFWSAILLTFLVSVPLRRGGATPDVSWLITMCERILHGETAYIDVFEVTPPVPLLPYADLRLAASFAGLTVAIKPPLFALPGIVVAAYYWSRTRSFSFLVSSGLLVAAVIALAVTAASLAAFPEYLGEIATVMRE